MKVFILWEYKLTKIDMKNTQLTFLDDVLVHIFLSDPPKELTDALEIKYGKGVVETERKTVKCSSVYGETTPEQVKFLTYWNKGEDVQAMSVLSEYRNDKCEKRFLSFVDISLSQKVTEVLEFDVTGGKERTDRINKVKKAELNDL